MTNELSNGSRGPQHTEKTISSVAALRTGIMRANMARKAVELA
jgi:hypothetical protein